MKGSLANPIGLVDIDPRVPEQRSHDLSVTFGLETLEGEVQRSFAIPVCLVGIDSSASE
jgi:hypothetical protein